MVAYRFWRIRLIEANSSPMAAKTIEMRSSIGGPNIAMGGTAISDSYYADGYQPANAFDTNDSSPWASNNATTNAYIGYDFGEGNEQSIVEIAYSARNDAAQQAPRVATVEASNDATLWDQIFNMRFGIFANGETKVRSKVLPLANPGKNPHRFWRINPLTHTDNFCSGTKAELMTINSNDNLVLTQMFRATDADHYEDWDANRLFDTDINPSNSVYAGSSWVAAEFFNPVTIDQFTWTSRADGVAYQAPISGTVDYSDDSVTWTSAWSWRFNGFAAGETKKATNPSLSGLDIAPRRHTVIVI